MKRAILFLLCAASLSWGQFVSVRRVNRILPTAATPTFDPAAGSYSGTQSVTIASTTSGATICFTTDNSDPAVSTPGTCSAGSTYSTPVSVAASATLKALATKSGYTNSSVASAAYTINSAFSVSDTFNWAGGPGLVTDYSANWTNNGMDTGMYIPAGANAAMGYDNNPAITYWSHDAFNADQYSTVTFTVSTNTGGVGPAARASTGGDGYAARLLSKTTAPYDCCYIEVYRYDSGTPVALLTLSSKISTVVSGDTMRLDVSGSATVSLRVRVSHTTLGDLYDQTFTDSTANRKTSGAAGISGGSNDPGMKIDSWTGGNQ